MRRTNALRLLLIALTALAVTLLHCPASLSSQHPAPDSQDEAQDELVTALATLEGHVRGERELDAEQIEALKLTIDRGRGLFGRDEVVIRAAFELVAVYDQEIGPLWIAHGPLYRRRQPPANDLHWTVTSPTAAPRAVSTHRP